MSNVIRKSILGATATAALVFAPVGAVAMADDVVDSPATDEVTEEVESIDSSDEDATDDSVDETDQQEEASAEENNSAEESVEGVQVSEEDSEPAEEPVKSADDSVEEAVEEELKSEKSDPAPAQKTEPKSDDKDKASTQEPAPEKKSVPAEKKIEDKKSDAAPAKETVKDDKSGVTASNEGEGDELPDEADQSDGTPAEEEGDELPDESDTGEREYTNVAHDFWVDHQNPAFLFKTLCVYVGSDCNGTNVDGWKIDVYTYDAEGKEIPLYMEEPIPAVDEFRSFPVDGPGVVGFRLYYLNTDNTVWAYNLRIHETRVASEPSMSSDGQSLIIPEDDNFDYTFTNSGETTSIGAGSHWIGSVGEVVVKATPKTDKVVIVKDGSTTEWSFNFVGSGDTGGGDDDVTVVTPDKGWLEHIQNPGEGDDDVKVRDGYQDKVQVDSVDHSDGNVNVVLVPKEGYAFPDDADEVTISLPEFVDTGNGDDDDDDTSEVTVITPQNEWLDHIQKPGKGDDQFEVKDEFADKVTIIMVDSDNAEPGKVNVVVMPNDGYAFPDEAASHTLTYDEFVKPVDSGDDDDNSNGGGDNDNGSGDDDGSGDTDTGNDNGNGDSDVDGGTNNGSSDDNDGTDGTKDDDSDDSDSDSKGGDGSKDDSNDNVDDKNSAKTDDKSDGKGGSDQSGKKDSSGKDGKSGQAGDGSDSLNQGFSADTGVDEPLTFAPVAGAALIVTAAAAGAIRRYRLQ